MPPKNNDVDDRLEGGRGRGRVQVQARGRRNTQENPEGASELERAFHGSSSNVTRTVLSCPTGKAGPPASPTRKKTHTTSDVKQSILAACGCERWALLRPSTREIFNKTADVYM